MGAGMTEAVCLAPTGDWTGEGAVWHAEEQALYWVDIENKRLRRFDHGTGAVREWQFPERIGSFALREKGGLVCAFESGLEDGVSHERRVFHSLFGTHDQKEGMDAFLNKRAPDFKHG